MAKTAAKPVVNTSPTFTSVRKRDGRIVPWDQSRIANAVYRAMQAAKEGDLSKDPLNVSNKVVQELAKKFARTHVPSIEEIQDVVEEILILADFPKTAKAYILYRSKRSEVREKRKLVPDNVRKLATESKKYFRNPLGEFIYYRTYSRWLPDEHRRETWVETVDRYLAFMRENLGEKLEEKEYDEVRKAILNQEVMPSMRLMWSAGGACRKTNVTAYNCSFIAPSKVEDFAEILYLLMCGTGVGFSVESQSVQRLPIIKRQTGKKFRTFRIEDSKEGWGDALTHGLKIWFEGGDVSFDFSLLRPGGARLKTMGGQSSGPGPLKALLEFSRGRILSRQGKRLTNIDVHDIICKIGEVVVMGGVRRSALISISDLDDEEMRHAKDGQFYLTNPQRSMANNSAVYNEKPDTKIFLEEWLALAKSGSGERGIFNRGGLKYQLPARRWKGFEKDWANSGTNPCGEINLKSKQFCNLTEVVARATDTEEKLLWKTRVATILGTYQSSLTDFKYLSAEWKKNCEEERLLGVSITGQWDSPAVRNPATLRKMKEVALETNREYAKKMEINASTCVTCIKPSGTVSQLVDAASGMHPRHSKFYIRRVRIAATDPLFQMLKDQKFPYHPEVGQAEGAASTYVLEFPVKAPSGSIFKDDLSSIEQLEYWKMVKENFTEHNPSVTISVGDNEWIETSNWLYRHWEILGGLSFLPRTDYVYKLAPYEEVSEEEYKTLVAKMPPVDFSSIIAYEEEDATTGSHELACVAGVCEVDFPEEAEKVAKSDTPVAVEA